MRSTSSHRVGFALALGFALSLAGCAPPRISEGLFACEAHSECPDGWFCRADRRCYAALHAADGAADPIDAAIDACTDCPSCGDGACDEGEDCESCAGDCGQCPSECGNGTCSDGEACANCADCQYGHRGSGDNGDSCDGVPPRLWRCVWSPVEKAEVAQSCQDRDGDGHWVWETFGTHPRDCAACVCTMSSACCQAGSTQLGCQ